MANDSIYAQQPGAGAEPTAPPPEMGANAGMIIDRPPQMVTICGRKMGANKAAGALLCVRRSTRQPSSRMR